VTRLSAANKLSVYQPILAKELKEEIMHALQEDSTND